MGSEGDHDSVPIINGACCGAHVLSSILCGTRPAAEGSKSVKALKEGANWQPLDSSLRSKGAIMTPGDVCKTLKASNRLPYHLPQLASCDRAEEKILFSMTRGGAKN